MSTVSHGNYAFVFKLIMVISNTVEHIEDQNFDNYSEVVPYRIAFFPVRLNFRSAQKYGFSSV